MEDRSILNNIGKFDRKKSFEQKLPAVINGVLIGGALR